MRIALYLNNLWGISATARIAHMLAKEFKKNNNEVIFVINKPPVEIAQEFPIRVLKKKGELLKAFELSKLCVEENIDVVLSFMRPQSNVSGLANRFFNRRRTAFIGSIHNSDNYLTYNKIYQLPYRYLEKWLLESNDKIVAVSNSVKKDLEEAFFINPQKVEVIYNPIDVNLIRQKAEEPIEPHLEELFKKHPVIVNVARMETQKGLHHLINIFERVNKKLPQTRLVLIGDGSLRRDLENQVLQKGLKDKVFFLGWRENPFPYVARSKVFALTSLWEGLAMVMLESFSLGVPIVAFKTRGGHVEVLENCCPLIEYPNENLYAETLIKILSDKSFHKKLQEKVLEKVKSFHSEVIASKYLALFEKVVKVKRKKFQD
ncbi:MAG TPA: glycosyltransferase [Aquificales bacterium]|nr:glycosyltransferase [Aquificales bacterium]